MLKMLEKRLGKIEKTVRTKQEEIDQGAWREQFREMRSTPEGRKLLRKLAEESVERIMSARQARERAQIAKMVPPEQLERFKKQWADEDAKEEARKKRDAENAARRKKWDEEGNENVG